MSDSKKGGIGPGHEPKWTHRLVLCMSWSSQSGCHRQCSSTAATPRLYCSLGIAGQSRPILTTSITSSMCDKDKTAGGDSDGCSHHPCSCPWGPRGAHGLGGSPSYLPQGQGQSAQTGEQELNEHKQLLACSTTFPATAPCFKHMVQ